MVYKVINWFKRIIVIFFIAELSLCQFDKGNIINTNQTQKITSLRVFKSNNQRIYAALGYQNGLLKIIDVNTEQIIFNKTFLTTPIVAIETNTLQYILIVYVNTTVVLNNQFQQISRIQIDNIFGFTLYSNESITNMVYYKKRELIQYAYQHQKQWKSKEKALKLVQQKGIDHVKFSQDQKFLYLVSNQGKKLSILQRKSYQKILKNTTINKTTENHAQMHEVFIPVQERQYSFNIKSIVIDTKDKNNQAYQGLIIVTQDHTLFALQETTIRTFIPYSTTPATLIAADFCQKLFFVTLHVQKNGSYIVSLFFKQSFLLYKAFSLQNMFKNTTKLKNIDCNFDKIFIAGQQVLYVVNGFDEFDIQKYISSEQIKIILILLLIFTVFFIFKKKKNQVQMKQDIHKKNLMQKQTQESENQGKQKSNNKKNSSSQKHQNISNDHSKKRNIKRKRS